MSCTKKTKNAELLGLRFPISFFRMKDELGANIYIINDISKPTFEFRIPTFTPLIK